MRMPGGVLLNGGWKDSRVYSPWDWIAGGADRHYIQRPFRCGVVYGVGRWRSIRSRRQLHIVKISPTSYCSRDFIASAEMTLYAVERS